MVCRPDHPAPQLQDDPGQDGEAAGREQQLERLRPEGRLCGALPDRHLQPQGGAQSAATRQVREGWGAGGDLGKLMENSRVVNRHHAKLAISYQCLL